MTKPKPNRTYSNSLKTLQHVGIEMARCYRKVKKGELDSSTGYRMVMMLSALKACLETSKLEERLAELEALILQEHQDQHFRPRIVS